MDESLQDLENELKRLRPRDPSARLLSRLEAELATPARASVDSPAATADGLLLWPWLNWRIAAAAAAVVAFATVAITSRQSLDRESGTTAPGTIAATAVPAIQETAVVPESRSVNPAPISDRYHPVGAASVLYDMKEDGPVTSPNSAPARRLRYRYVDTYTWKNPATNASLKWSVPRDEVRVIPASLH